MKDWESRLSACLARQVDSSTSYSIISPPKIVLKNSHVNELINPDSYCWGVDLIDQIFLPYETIRIKSIPLSSEGTTEFFELELRGVGAFLQKRVHI